MDDQTTQELLKAAGLSTGGIATSGIIVSLFVFLLNYAKTWPVAIFHALKRLLIYSIQLDNSDPMYTNMAMWISNRPNLTKTKNFIVRSGRVEEGVRKANLVLGHGYHTFFYKGGLFILGYSEESKDGGTNKDPIVYRKFRIRVVWGGKRALDNFLSEIEVAEQENRKTISIYQYQWGWYPSSTKIKRDTSTLVLRDGTMDDLVKDINTFFDSREWYRSVGIPWRRGYLFHGEPGTGKSSVAFVLASHFNLPIYTMNVRELAERLPMAFASIPPNSLILLEDIDTSNVTRGSTDNVNLGTLLNTLDGVSAQEGSIVVMTTNKRSQLDTALIRPGRVDRMFYIGLADKFQIEGMFHKFFPNESAKEFLRRVPENKVTPASLQEHLLKYRHDCIEAIVYADTIPHYVELIEETEKEEKKEEVKEVTKPLTVSPIPVEVAAKIAQTFQELVDKAK